MHKQLIFLMLVASLGGCTYSTNLMTKPGNHTADEAKQQAFKAEEYAVYSAVFDSLYVPSKRKSITVKDSTWAYRDSRKGLGETLRYVNRQTHEAIAPETLDDFQNKNTESHSLKNLLDPGREYVFVSKQDLEGIFRRDGGWSGWSEFFEKYPQSGSLMTLSRIGFNPEMNQALVYVASQSGITTGEGYYVLLVKENNAWVIQHKIEVWLL